MPSDPGHRMFTVAMELFDLPKDENIFDTVPRQYRTVTGREPEGVGTAMPGSYSGDSTSHLWRAEAPSPLYALGRGSESETIHFGYSGISDMEQVAKVLALTALDVCTLPKWGRRRGNLPHRSGGW